MELLSLAIRFFFACLDMFNFVKLLESEDCPDLQSLQPSCISVALDADKVLVTQVLGRTFTQAFLRSCISTRFSQLQGGISCSEIACLQMLFIRELLTLEQKGLLAILNLIWFCLVFLFRSPKLQLMNNFQMMIFALQFQMFPLILINSCIMLCHSNEILYKKILPISLTGLFQGFSHFFLICLAFCLSLGKQISRTQIGVPPLTATYNNCPHQRPGRYCRPCDGCVESSTGLRVIQRGQEV